MLLGNREDLVTWMLMSSLRILILIALIWVTVWVIFRLARRSQAARKPAGRQAGHQPPFA
jgi:hypothetical protein